MESVYPAGPASCPDDLTRPTASYKGQAWLAVVGLLGFVVLYFALAFWFSWSSFNMLWYAYQTGFGALLQWVVGFSALFLAVFMIKALFFVRKGGEPDDLEVTAEQEPVLFEFLHSLADEAGAPRPHRVFLSGRVNAAVFYDLSIKNLIFPSRKNLEIGLGLVNILGLSEFKAVLAHEFGHFAQRSMAVGNWVYIAQQIAAYIIAQRDILDRFLRQLSFMDIRIAWIGWLLRLVVWSLRSILETVFEWVVLAQRALSREMEFQADLVSVSLAGSDAIVNALYKLQAADDAWDKTMSFLGSEMAAGRETADVFAIQHRVLERMADIYNDPDYGRLPKEAADPDAQLRLFKTEVAQPPRMWATHPPSHEREDNAKERYVECPADARSGWAVFGDAATLRQNFSKRLQSAENLTPLSTPDSVEKLDQRYQREFLRSEYQGVYLGRSCVRHCASPNELFEVPASATKDELGRLYPDALADTMDRLRDLQREQGLLGALQDGSYDAPGGVIRHRGTELQVHELPGAIDDLRDECEALERELQGHDMTCRSLHHWAATQAGSGWASYHSGLLHLLHYADHAEANIRDAHGALLNVYRIITADRHVSGRERKRLLAAANELQAQLAQVYGHSEQVLLNDTLKSELGIGDWSEALGEWGLPEPTPNNISSWFDSAHQWVEHAAGHLGALRGETLEQLLACEATLRSFMTENMAGKSSVAEPPATPESPVEFTTLLSGSERELQKKLGLWDRFQTADGAVAGTVRLLVALGIVGSALYLTFVVPVAV